MKVHKFQIEIMWVFLATMFCPTQEHDNNIHVYNDNIRGKLAPKESWNYNIIRPPP